MHVGVIFKQIILTMLDNVNLKATFIGAHKKVCIGLHILLTSNFIVIVRQ